MVEKNYIERVREAADDFSQIYAELYADYEAKFKKAYYKKPADDPDAAIKYEIADAWMFLFGAPIESLSSRSRSSIIEGGKSTQTMGAETSDAKGLFLDDSLNRAVLLTVRNLKLHEKRLGGFVTNDVGVTRAIDGGKINIEDLEHLYKNPITDQLKINDSFVSRPKVDGSDPFFWRALLEIFCRAYNAPSGRPGEWSNERKFSLAFDLIEIWQTHFKNQKWSKKSALKELRKDKKYKDKYFEKGRWKVGLSVVSEVAKWVEPMNDRPIVKLAKRDPDLFSAEVDARQRVSIKNVGDLLKVIGDSRSS